MGDVIQEKYNYALQMYDDFKNLNEQTCDPADTNCHPSDYEDRVLD